MPERFFISIPNAYNSGKNWVWMQICNMLLHDSPESFRWGLEVWSQRRALPVWWTEERKCHFRPDKQRSLHWVPHLRGPYILESLCWNCLSPSDDLDPARAGHARLPSPYFSHSEISLILYLQFRYALGQLNAPRLIYAYVVISGPWGWMPVIGGWAVHSSWLIGNFFWGTVQDWVSRMVLTH